MSADFPESVSDVYLDTSRVGKGGKGRTATVVRVEFTGDLDPSSAQRLSNYVLTQAGKDKKIGTRDDVRVPLASASYDPESDTVTLVPKGGVRLRLNSTIQLRINGAGILDADGVAVDGDDDGAPGGKAIAVVSKGETSINDFDQSSADSFSLSALAVDDFLASTPGEREQHIAKPGRKGKN